MKHTLCIDIDLYRDEPGLEVDRGTAESPDRGGHGNDGASAPLATQTMYRDFAYLDQPAIEACARLDRSGAFIFNCWVEAWGDMRWYRLANDDPNAAALAVVDGRPAEGLFGICEDADSDREGPGGRHARAWHGRNRAGHSRCAGRRQAGLVAAGADKLHRQKIPRGRRIVAVPCNTKNSPPTICRSRRWRRVRSPMGRSSCARKGISTASNDGWAMLTLHVPER